ncbi:MAG: PAS domain S-box protein [Calditrichaeota bacterium]|nr:PAS domain S-box protein [Calditrichota bacterium]
MEWTDETHRRFDKDASTHTPDFEYFVDRIHPDDRKNVQDAINNALKNDTQYYAQARIINESGREWMMETFGVVSRDDDGSPISLAGTSQDITDKKQVEESLSKANEDLHVHQVELEQQNDELRKSQLQITELQNKYFDLYEMAPVGYLTFNEKGLITEANLTSCTMLGIEKSVFKGLGFSNFTDEESQDDFYLHRRQVIETKTQQTCELTLVRKDKSKFLARLESKAVFDDKGEFIQLNTNIIDIGKPK